MAKRKIYKLQGDVHMSVNMLLKENECSVFYHGQDTDIALLLATIAKEDKRFANILKMATHFDVTFDN